MLQQFEIETIKILNERTEKSDSLPFRGTKMQQKKTVCNECELLDKSERFRFFFQLQLRGCTFPCPVYGIVTCIPFDGKKQL